MEVGKTNTVAQQISVEEYDKQKSEYTQNALKELREQMRNIENNHDVLIQESSKNLTNLC
jgi:uncharacterized protein YcbK (DUF882 family)